MRQLLLIRGAPGSGKSTWIRENGLEPFTLSSDSLRLIFGSFTLCKEGKVGINGNNDKDIWSLLFQILERRMKQGCFTVIDATNSKTEEMSKYKKLAEKYKYRIYLIDFTNIDIKTAKERNQKREEYKRVPEEVIDRMYNRFKTNPVPSEIKVIKPEELSSIFYKPIDLSSYKKIHCIGDIHGCNTVLQEYLKGKIKEDEFYIFVGDYIDRGIENVDVLKFILTIKDFSNTLLLEGNHERWLKAWSEDLPISSFVFRNKTQKEIEEAGITKKEIRKLYRSLGQCAYFTYNDKTFFVSHGGLGNINNLSFINTEEIIKGNGNYNSLADVYKSFLSSTSNNTIMIHGHRNIDNLSIKIHDRIYNLEGKIEFGGDLRVVTISKDRIETHEIKNTIYNKDLCSKKDCDFKSKEESLIYELTNNPYIIKKDFDHISSFNFSRNAFKNKVWNNRTIKARGLYFNTEEKKIIARGYEKFFNIEENETVSFASLKGSFKYPLKVYKKENGFLGIVSYDSKTDDFIIASKSVLNGEHVDLLKNIFYSSISEDKLNKLKKYIKKNNVSFVFEVIDIENDPHIIKYNENKIILLDIIYNEIEFKKYSYEELIKVAEEFDLEYKELCYTLNNWEEFLKFYKLVSLENFTYNFEFIEGFVLEDENGFMIKIKTFYYNLWKYLRIVANITLKNGSIKDTSNLKNPISINFYSFLQKLYIENKEIKKDIISLREEFYNS